MTAILIGLACGIAVPVLFLAAASAFSKAPDLPPPADGRLPACPSSPNCVSSQAPRGDKTHHVPPLPMKGSAEETARRLRNFFEEELDAEVKTAEGNYFHLVFTTAIFRFRDDVQLLISPEEDVIHIRSASRAGHSDLGANRRRVEMIRERWSEY